MKVSNLNWKIGGEAGFGILSTGNIFSKIFSRKGYYAVDNIEYPSLIRGGHNTFTARVSTDKIYSISSSIDILVALNKETVEMHQDEVTYGGYVIYDGGDYDIKEIEGTRKDIKYIPVPLLKIVSDIKASKVMINNVALGASVALLDYDMEALKGVIRDVFKRKSKKIVDLNIRASELGYRFIKDILKIKAFELEIVKPSKKILITGNDAVFLGGVRAGCKFYAAYPMTPSSSILHSFASVEDDFNIVTKHAEDEIAVINMVIGASFAGVRAMAATSGGGFSLMNEGLGSAAMTETPLVLVLSQRPAPATGLPTWTGQGDMLFAIHSSHGEFLRVVMAPGDVQECFYCTVEAFNLAEKYQIPVIILLDKYLSESHFSLDKLDYKGISVERGKLIDNKKDVPDGFLRYKNTEDGISPRVVLGLENGMHIANSDEHDEYGYSEEDAYNRKMMTDKRFKKITDLVSEIPLPSLYGPTDAEITLWSWGSCKGPILEAMKLLNQKEKKANLIHFKYLYPFDSEFVGNLISKNSKNVVIENNKTSQLSKLMMMNTGYRVKNKILKYSGRQFLPEEIIKGVEKIE